MKYGWIAGQCKEYSLAEMCDLLNAASAAFAPAFDAWLQVPDGIPESIESTAKRKSDSINLVAS